MLILRGLSRSFASFYLSAPWSYSSLPDCNSSFISQHSHDAGADSLRCDIRDVLSVRILHVNYEHHADQANQLDLEMF